MELITLAGFKAHARIADNSEDVVAQQIVDAANEYVTGLLDIDDEGSPPAYSPPADVKQAALTLAAHWWENRDAVNVGNIVTEFPLGFEDAIINHRSWAF